MPHTHMPLVCMPHTHTPSQSISQPSQSIGWHASHTHTYGWPSQSIGLHASHTHAIGLHASHTCHWLACLSHTHLVSPPVCLVSPFVGMPHTHMPLVGTPHTHMPSVGMPHTHTPSQSISLPSQSIGWHATHSQSIGWPSQSISWHARTPNSHLESNLGRHNRRGKWAAS